jgi:hypothetical protein
VRWWAVLDWRNPADYEYTAGLTLHQWAWEFLRRNPEYQATWERFKDADQATRLKAAQHWGMSYLVDPDLAAPESRYGFLEAAQVTIMFSWNQVPKDDRYIVLMFDLELPATPQLIDAEGVVRTLQESRRTVRKLPVRSTTARAQRDLYPEYVRVLDASSDGLGARAIGKALYPKLSDPEAQRGRVRDILDRARELAAGGYRELLLLTNEPL